MPINELECHPFLNYYEQLNCNKNHFKGLIVGSFPIYSITDSLDENLNIVERFNQDEASMKFFYGSNRSNLWRYLSAALYNDDPTELMGNENLLNNDIKQRVIDFLFNHNLLVTDTLKQTNRNGTSSLDSDLFIEENANDFILENISLNYDIVNLLENNQNIKDIFFTSTQTDNKSPFGWFSRIFHGSMNIINEHFIDNRCWAIECMINGKEYNLFLLPTPKPRGIHFTPNQQTLMFSNYIQSTNLDFYNEIIDLKEYRPNQKIQLSELRNNFLIECYRQAFLHLNLNFNGAI